MSRLTAADRALLIETHPQLVPCDHATCVVRLQNAVMGAKVLRDRCRKLGVDQAAALDNARAYRETAEARIAELYRAMRGAEVERDWERRRKEAAESESAVLRAELAAERTVVDDFTTAAGEREAELERVRYERDAALVKLDKRTRWGLAWMAQVCNLVAVISSKTPGLESHAVAMREQSARLMARADPRRGAVPRQVAEE